MLDGEIQTRLERAGRDAGEGELLDFLPVLLNGSRARDAFVDERAEAFAECLLCHDP
jgi:hypothetical protein